MSIGTMRAIGAIVAVVLMCVVLMLFGAAVDPFARAAVIGIGARFGGVGTVLFPIVVLVAW
jgi:hypothetical protein